MIMTTLKTLVRRTLILAAFVALVFSVFISRGFSKNSPTIPVIHQPTKTTLVAGLPVRLQIPKIHVDSVLGQVGLTPAGAVAVPVGPTNAAWFDLGPRPGEVGNAIIVGNYGWKNGIPAVFDKLYSLHAGDLIYVVDGQGVTTTFVVRQIRLYGSTDDPSAVFVSSDGKDHLNLITCEGVWSASEKSYSKRLVVFADKV